MDNKGRRSSCLPFHKNDSLPTLDAVSSDSAKVDSDETPAYLAPYVRAVRRHGDGFGSLLWASRRTQETRFGALCRLRDLSGCSVLDVGCGRADLLDYLLRRGMTPADYVGLEAVGTLAKAAGRKKLPNCTIIEGDFVSDPRRMYVGADVVLFSGSLNTLSDEAFYRTLGHAFEASAQEVVFNYLCSDELAGTRYLNWHKPADVMDFARKLTPHVLSINGYISGDCSVSMRKSFL